MSTPTSYASSASSSANLSSQTVLTGIKPTDYVHLGNYLGAIRPGIALSAQAKASFLFIADYHAIISLQNPAELREYTYSQTAAWLACGLDPKRTVIFRQSDVPEVMELSWILGCSAPKGLLNRAHAYKAKVQENQESGKEDLDFGVSMGLYSYPVLMSSDIISFGTDVVPVGEDQVQHVEIARDIAQKFNRTYGEILRLPKAFVQTEKVLPGLDGRKMSKSYGNHIPLFLDSKKLRKLVMKIVTDSTPPEVPKDPSTSVVFQIYKEFATPAQIQELSARYAKGIGWGEAKEALFQVIEAHFAKPLEVYNDYLNNREKLEAVLLDGAARARAVAGAQMVKVRSAVRGI